MRRLVLGAILVAATSNIAPAADVENGKAIFNRCRACHEIGEHAKNLVGPDLNGVVGRKAGTEPGYHYSEATKDSGIIWTEANLHKYLKNPRAMIPGTKMVFPGLSDDQDIDDVIAYLKQFGPDGKIIK